MDETTVADPGLDFERFLAGSELRSAYQRIVDVASGEIDAFEALARWPGLSGPGALQTSSSST